MKRVAAWGCPLGVAGVAAFLASDTLPYSDNGRFIAAGRTLLSTHWRYAFASKYIQAAPLQLALFGSVGRSETVLAVVLAVATALLLVAAADAVGVSAAITAALGLFAVWFGFTRVGYQWGHPADAVVPLAWIFSVIYARRGQTVRAGLLVGLAADLETWGIIGIASLAAAPRWRSAGRGALAACAVPAASAGCAVLRAQE